MEKVDSASPTPQSSPVLEGFWVKPPPQTAPCRPKQVLLFALSRSWSMIGLAVSLTVTECTHADEHECLLHAAHSV